MNSANLGWFLLSQTIYTIGSFAIMSALFQLRFLRHIRIIFIISVLNSAINYCIYFNKEVDIGYMASIVVVLITFIYLAAVLKIPVIWSFVVTVSGGVVVPLVIQLAIIFSSFGFFMPHELKEHIWRNYALDSTSGIAYCLIAVLLYLRGWSFTFDFEKIRVKWEKRIVITITSCAALCLPTTIAFTKHYDFTLNLTFLSFGTFVVFLILLGYAVKKEKDENEFLKPIEEVKKDA